MATITVRVDDAIRDALDEMAHDQGVKLSDLVRGLLREAVIRIPESEDRSQEVPSETPDSLTSIDRQTLALLHRILARVLPEDANDTDGDPAYQLERARVLEAGYAREYTTEFAGVDEELTRRDCERVMDILDMFRIIDYSVDHLARESVAVDESVVSRLQYLGFDHNDALEGKMADYVEYLIDKNRWSERRDFVKGPSSGNSHMSTLGLYGRMLTEYRRITERRQRVSRTDYLLSGDDLKLLADATTHPSRRTAEPRT